MRREEEAIKKNEGSDGSKFNKNQGKMIEHFRVSKGGNVRKLGKLVGYESFLVGIAFSTARGVG